MSFDPEPKPYDGPREEKTNTEFVEYNGKSVSVEKIREVLKHMNDQRDILLVVALFTTLGWRRQRKIAKKLADGVLNLERKCQHLETEYDIMKRIASGRFPQAS